MLPNKEEYDQDDALVEILEQAEDYSYKNLFRIIRARLRYRRFDGHMSEAITRVNFERGDSVGVLLYDPGVDVVVLVRQFRYPVYAGLEPDTLMEGGSERAWILEVVAGIIDPGHSVVDIALNELLEESGGMVRGDLRPIATIYPSPGGSSERIHLFLGLVDQEDRMNEGGGLTSPGEDIQVERFPFQEAMKMIERGEISDGKTIIALQHLALLKAKGIGFQG